MRNDIVKPLLKWYKENKRDLPWREQRNAYYTWISEIMLQQTRVEAVKPYFQRFIIELPDVSSLAKCPEDKLMKLWEGLGYYSRVRNMQAAAIQVMEKHQGKLPESLKELKDLKGIGNYTAGAIASIAYGIPAPAVDGNVLRVISRITESREDITKQKVKDNVEQQLMEIIPKDAAGDFNQALMELGAVVCVPNGAPHCEKCPICEFCCAKKHGTYMEIPVKAPKKKRIIEERTVFVIQDGERTVIRKRPKEGLLAGLFELPNVKGYLSQDEAIDHVKEMDLEPLYIEELPEAKHIFSHIEWRMRGYRIKVAAFEKIEVDDILFVEKQQSTKNYAIPSAFKAYFKYLKEEKQ